MQGGRWLPVVMLVCGLAIRAQADADATGPDVRVPNPMAVVYEGAGARECATNWGDAIGLVGARNGAVSGQAVVFLPSEGPGSVATVGDLKGPSGAVLPASRIEVRYALPTGGRGTRGHRLSEPWTAFDGLSTKPRATGTVHPVCITVNIPAQAVPGNYEGALSVAGRSVPIRLSVAKWTLPDPVEYQTWVDFIQSPESVALRYGVELWSDAHWALIGKSFEQMRKVGCRVLYLEVIGHTNLGNEQSMVRWIRKGERPLAKAPAEWTGRWKEFLDQSGQKLATTEPVFEHDFSVVERYADLFIAKVGMPRVVVLDFYEAMVCGGQGLTVKDVAKGAPITLLDPATKAISMGEGPSHDCPTVAYPNFPEQSVTFWTPVIEGLRERLRKRGVADSAIMLGMCGDMLPGKQDFAWWKATFPGMRFVRESHGLSGMIGGMEVGYATIVYGGFPSGKQLAAITEDPASRPHGWMPKNIRGENTPACFPRDINRFAFATQLTHGRLLGEMNILGRQKGFGRMSADFWPCLKNSKGEVAHGIAARYPDADWKQLNLAMTPYLHPGDDGAQGTLRFEMLREGVQTCEAVILLDRAVAEKAFRARIGDALAKRIHALLLERFTVIATFNDKYNDPPDFSLSGWQERDRRLFELAAEVQEALPAK